MRGEDPYDLASRWDEPKRKAWDEGRLFNGRVRPVETAFRAAILDLMAGAEAVTIILGSFSGGMAMTRREIEGILEDAGLDHCWDRYEPRMRRQVQRLVRKHRQAIERVAGALLARGTLEGSDIDALMSGNSNTLTRR
jgi:hypothetical protein